jgi:hypothetical protein
MRSIARVSGMVKPLFEHDAVELAQQAGMRQAALKVTLRSYLLHGRLQGPYLQAGRRRVQGEQSLAHPL